MTITRCEFSAETTDFGYRYTTQFFAGNSLHSLKHFDFHSAASSPTHPRRLVDIYSQNGSCTQKFSALFKNAIRELESTFAKYKTEAHPMDTIVTLDLKDKNLSYLNQEEIMQAEKRFCSFISEDYDSASEAQTPVRGPDDYPYKPMKVEGIAHRLLKQMNIQYVLREGSLKADLLPSLTEPQKAFFLASGTAFCEFTEIFMTACKQGDTVTDLPPLKNYIVPIGKEPFTPRTPHEVWYPEFYKELYAPDSRITRMQSDIFSVSAKDEGDIVVTEIHSPKKMYSILPSPGDCSTATWPAGISSAGTTPENRQ